MSQTITFDKSASKFVSKALGTLRGRNCAFCGTPLNQENWAGASKDVGFFCKALPCLIDFSKLKHSTSRETGKE